MQDWMSARRENARLIWQAAAKLPGLRVPGVPPWADHAAYKCYVFVDSAALLSNWNRDRIMVEINDRGVPCYSGSCSEIYREKAFSERGLGPANRLPIARQLGETSLMFLVHPTLTQDYIDQTCMVLTDVLAEAVGSR